MRQSLVKMTSGLQTGQWVMDDDSLVIEFLCDPRTIKLRTRTILAMTDMRLLAELVDSASKRHNDASGRRLAEIAKADGFDVSHSTLNKIRKGTYTSEPSVATLRAIAHLARVAEEKVIYSVKDPKGVEDAAVERAFVEWLNAWYKAQNQILAYARLRGIRFEDAEEELQDVKRMFEDAQHGGKRPWTPPWNPGPQFDEDEEPWKSEFWSYTEAVPSPFGGEGHIYQIGLTYDLAKARANREKSEHADRVWEEDKERQAVEYYQSLKSAAEGDDSSNDAQSKADLDAWIRRSDTPPPPGPLAGLIKRPLSSPVAADLTLNDAETEDGDGAPTPIDFAWPDRVITISLSEHYAEMFQRAQEQERNGALVEQATELLGDDKSPDAFIPPEIDDRIYVQHLAARFSSPIQGGDPELHRVAGLTAEQYDAARNRFNREFSEMIVFNGHIRTIGAPAFDDYAMSDHDHDDTVKPMRRHKDWQEEVPRQPPADPLNDPLAAAQSGYDKPIEDEPDVDPAPDDDEPR